MAELLYQIIVPTFVWTYRDFIDSEEEIDSLEAEYIEDDYGDRRYVDYLDKEKAIMWLESKAESEGIPYDMVECVKSLIEKDYIELCEIHLKKVRVGSDEDIIIELTEYDREYNAGQGAIYHEIVFGGIFTEILERMKKAGSSEWVDKDLYGRYIVLSDYPVWI